VFSIEMLVRQSEVADGGARRRPSLGIGGAQIQLKQFKVTKYRNILDSEWIDVNASMSFVGQNEAGKSNLFEALYRINPIKRFHFSTMQAGASSAF
jgi:hypothetical protein